MNIALHRYSHNDTDTLGTVFLDGAFFCYSLEDAPSQSKISGKTRIPSGTYEVKFRKVLSGKTKQYRKRYSWFEWHLELQNVPNFKYVYIHIGNDHGDTDGCILVGNTANNNSQEQGFIGSSTPIFNKLYNKVYLALTEGERVYITILDEQYERVD